MKHFKIGIRMHQQQKFNIAVIIFSLSIITIIIAWGQYVVGEE